MFWNAAAFSFQMTLPENDFFLVKRSILFKKSLCSEIFIKRLLFGQVTILVIIYWWQYFWLNTYFTFFLYNKFYKKKLGKYSFLVPIYCRTWEIFKITMCWKNYAFRIFFFKSDNKISKISKTANITSRLLEKCLT